MARIFRLVKEQCYWPWPYSIEEQEPPKSSLAGQWFKAKESRLSVTRIGAWRALRRRLKHPPPKQILETRNEEEL